MLRLAGTNALAIVTFALIYAAGGSRWLTQGAFLASLAVFFVSLTALWVYVERTRPGARDVLSRIGRGVLALVVVVIGLPAVVLAPLFALQEALPPEAGFADVVRPVMVLLLLALVLVIAMNVAGTVVLAVSGLRSRLSRGRGAAS
jgi:hypothetical protein